MIIVAGYFMWLKTQTGIVMCEKVDIGIYDGMQRTNKKDYDARIVKRVPLDADEWKLSLHALSEKYPPPGKTVS